VSPRAYPNLRRRTHKYKKLPKFLNVVGDVPVRVCSPEGGAPECGVPKP